MQSRTFILTLLTTLLLPVLAAAYNFQPGRAYFSGAKSGDSRLFTVTNAHNRVTPVEISIFSYRRNLDGEKVRKELPDDDFIVYPEQMVLMHGDERHVQVRWIGDPSLAAERADIILCEEVPMPEAATPPAAEEPGSRLKITNLVNYEGRLYVTPRGATADLVVESLAPPALTGPTDGGPQFATAILFNRGGRRTSLKGMRLRLAPQETAAAGDAAVEFALTDLVPNGSALLAKGRRRMRIPWPAELGAVPVRAVVLP